LTPFLGEWDKVVIELDHKDATTGLSHRFTVWKGHCERRLGLSCDIGQRLLVAIGVDPKGRRRRTLRTDIKGILEIAERNGDDLGVLENQVYALRPSVPINVTRDLLALSGSSSWARDTWLFHVDNMHLEATAVRPITSRTTIRYPVELAALMTARQAQIGQLHKVSISIDRTRGTLEIVGPDPVAIEAAAIELKAIADLPVIVGRLPYNTTGMVIGRGGETIGRLKSRTNVLDIHIENDTVTVIGNTANAVGVTIKEIRSLVTKVTGEMIVPAGKNGLLIGKGGSKIKSLSADTGCRLDNPDRGQRWMVEGPTKDDVRNCIRMATQAAPGTTGRISQIKTLEIIADRTKARSTAKSSKVKSPSDTTLSSVLSEGIGKDSLTGWSVAILVAVVTAVVAALVVIFLWK